MVTEEGLQQPAEEFHFPDDDYFPEDEHHQDKDNNNLLHHSIEDNFPEDVEEDRYNDSAAANGNVRGIIKDFDRFPEEDVNGADHHQFESSSNNAHSGNSGTNSENWANPHTGNDHHNNNISYYDDSEDEDDAPNNTAPSQQERIREEIKFDHLREIETRRQQQNQNLDTSYTASDYEDFVTTSRNLGRSIQSLDDFGNEDEDEDDGRGSVDSGEEEETGSKKQLSAAEKIHLELMEQNQKERELKEIHRSLSRENICNYDSDQDYSEDEEFDGEVLSGRHDSEDDTQHVGKEHQHN